MPTQRLHAWLDPATAVPGPSGQPRVIHDEGVPLPVREIIDMRGAGVTATDDEANDTTVITIPGAAAGTVVSVFGRPGPAVTAQAGDYNWSQIASKPSVFPPEAHQHPWGDITGTPASFPPAAHVHAAADVTSGVFATGRLGSGTGSASNYLRGDGVWTALTASQVSGAVPDTRQVIAGTGLSGGGALSGNVTLTANIAAIQTPWTQHVNGAGFELRNTARVGIGTASPGVPLDVVGLARIKGVAGIGSALDIETSQGMAVTRYLPDGGLAAATPANRAFYAGFYQTNRWDIFTYDGTTIGNPYVTVTNAGKVGIGMSSPGYLLSFGAVAQPRMIAVYEGGGDFYGFGIGAGSLRYDAGIGGMHSFVTGSGGTERLRIDAAGGVLLWLGGALKTLSVDGSGFVKAA